ncbi:MAG: 30S ribosomal protein S20 [Thermodesulfobacteriota bacterium]|nr:30S ribosomal protein S20 [Thermodesulfobacteriota bacterium]
MANHKSAVKRSKQNIVRKTRNIQVRTTMRNLVKAVRLAVADGNKEAATSALEKAIPFIDKACGKGVIHKSTASRKVGRLTKLVNTMD